MHEAVVRLMAEDEQEFEFYRAMHYLTGALWAAGLADRAIEALHAVSSGATADLGGGDAELAADPPDALFPALAAAGPTGTGLVNCPRGRAGR
jgi:hypothetical protein